MPILPSLPPSNIKRLFLPTTATLPEADQAWVDMEVNPANVKDWLQTDPSGNLGKLSINILTDRIKNWNYTEEDGTAVPITADTIIRMGNTNLTFLAQQIETSSSTTLTAEEKKT